jgi:adenylate cyclase
MSFEIERKFLVRGNDWERLATRRISLRQAYLACNGKASIRIRIKDDGAATLTVKSRPADLRRLELEYDIPVLEAEALMKLRQGSITRRCATSSLTAISPGKSMCSPATISA